jgi:hypothetical protein
VHLESGVVGVHSLTGGESAGPPLRVGPPGTYAVRAYRTGADDVDAEVSRDPEAEPHSVERFLLQFWPRA